MSREDAHYNYRRKQGGKDMKMEKAKESATHSPNFIGLYKGKQYESHAVSMYAAQKEIAKRVGARHDYDVSVYATTETEQLASAIEHEKTQYYGITGTGI